MKITKIMKFGGTSVGSPERIKSLVPLITGSESKIVVLSEMSGTTNSLIEITKLLYGGDKKTASDRIEALRAVYHKVVDELYETDEYKKTGREMIDSHFNSMINIASRPFARLQERAIVGEGELISTALLHKLLLEKGFRAKLIPAMNFMRIDKDGEPDYYYIEENLRRELRKHDSKSVLITQGFICRNVKGEIDNLKRGGSDFTASLIGSVLKVEEIQIWTDINGFHNNDPRYVENTEVIRELSFDEAAELAYFGAKILHPSSITPARDNNIPVRLKNTLHPEDEGTLITSSSELIDYKAVAAKDGISVIRIRSYRMLMAYGFLRKVFEIFVAYKTPIDMITTSEVSISITIDNPQYLREIATDLSELGKVETEEDQTIICIVGDFRMKKTGSAPEIFEALNTIPLKMISYGGSDISLSLLTDTSHKKEALRLLSKHLFPH